MRERCVRMMDAIPHAHEVAADLAYLPSCEFRGIRDYMCTSGRDCDLKIVHVHASTHALALTHVGRSVFVCTSSQEYTHSCMRIRVIRADTR